MASGHDSGFTFGLRSGDDWRDPFDDYRQLRDRGAVVEADHDTYGCYYVLPRFADVFSSVRDTTTFSSAQGLTLDPDAMAMFAGVTAPIVMMDPPQHTTMRRAVSRQMTPRRVAEFEPAIRAFVGERLDQVAAANGGEVDIIATLAKPLPSFVVAHYLGVPAPDRARFDGWTEAIVAAGAAGAIEQAGVALGELIAYAEELMELKRTIPGDDLVTDLIQAEGEAATPGWIIGFIFTMVTGGNDTVTGLLGGALELLQTHRDQRALLVADPTLIAPAVEEFLRLTSPVQNLARSTTTEVGIEGTTLPAGARVLLHYGAANRDEREFGPDADSLDVRRNPRRTLALGHGAHHCLGAAAARAQGAVAIEELLARFPDFSVDIDRGRFAPGPFVRRYHSLPMVATGA